MHDASIDTVLQAYGDSSPVLVSGQNLASTAYLAASLCRSAPEEFSIVLLPSERDAIFVTKALQQYLQPALGLPSQAEARVLHIPSPDLNPYSDMSGDRKGLRGRMGGLYALTKTPESPASILVLSATSLLRRVMPKSEFISRCDTIEVNKEIDRELLSQCLVAAGYQHATLVEEPGQFAIRGGVVDVFPPVYRFPVRMELFGDEVESIRHFDSETQRTLRQCDSFVFHPVRETITTQNASLRGRLLEAADRASHPSKATRQLIETVQRGEEFVGIEKLVPAFHETMDSLLSYLPERKSCHWIVHQPEQCLGKVSEELEDAQRRFLSQVEDGQIAFPPEEHYLSLDTIDEILSQNKQRIDTTSLQLSNSKQSYASSFHIPVDDNIGLRGRLDRKRNTKDDDLINPLLEALANWREAAYRVVIVCSNAARLQRMTALLESRDASFTVDESLPMQWDSLAPGDPVLLCRGELESGFTIAADALAVLTDSDIFGEKKHSNRRQKRAAKRAREALKGGVSDFSQLNAGDYLVHRIHGVGLYTGLKKLPIQGIPIDFLHLEYNGGNLYLPVVRIGEVQRYVGADGLKPRLDKLGGLSFAKTKRTVSKKVHALAEELLQLYAQRAALPGHAYPPPDALFHEFEASFEFEETPDQQKAIDDIAHDMGQPRPMDRLVCGDVGYGKTEVAMRAVLRAVFGNKQVAFLGPTTVLVEQHYQSMRKRFEGWPIRVARLSRFQSKSEQLATIKDIANGKIDAVVGTHRLLSKDVRFKDLGLVVVDEEQRFGVTHKERFKKMRASVEVLTLTATPIPRTLHLAMTGLRDLSIIATPPVDRRAIRTFVARTEDGLLREAIAKELDRKGQIFFVSPRIDNPIGGKGRSLEEWAKHLKTLAPTAKIGVAHGKLTSDALEKIMVDFVDGNYDILVSTTIVEAGLDIPRANTMFIDRADRFGLSQLYQLRGRIGRSKERAYCYLMVPSPEKLSDDARKRLETLQRYTELGAGFSIASQDLEIRGAGDLLGAKQSGSIAAIGFDAYTQMLEEAVAELQGSPIYSERDPELNVDIAGYIPDDYVPETAQRLALYKRLASATDEEEIREILEEIADCYGPIPGEVGVLGELMVVKSHARHLRVVSLELGPTRLALALSEHTPLSREKIVKLVAAKDSHYKVTPDMRLIRQFTGKEQERPVEVAKATLLQLLACATSTPSGS